MRVRGLLGACILLGTLAVGTAEAAPRATAAPPVVGIISAGWGTACAIVTFHSVRCWGVNEFGTLGNGTTTSLEANPLPGEVSSPGTEVQAVAGGLNHTCEIDGGNVRCWGWNAFGQLGTGDFNDRTTPAGSVATSGPASRIAAGNGHTCAIVAGGVQCWGHNDQGQLGNGQPGCDPEDLWSCQSATPVTVSGLSGVTALAAGNYHTCALAGGAVRCWGANYSGQLGNGGPIDPTGFENVPVSVSGLGGDVTGIATGSEHTCAVTEAGAIKCWGYNGFGQLGDGTKTDRSSPVTVSQTGAARIAAGWDHTCLTSTKGGVACWGRNNWGQLGDGTTKGRQRPVAVSGLGIGSGVHEVTGGYGFTCALLRGFEIQCWGRNDFGQLGDGTTTSRTKPVVTLFDCLGEAPTIASKPGEPTIGTSGNDVIVGTSGRDLIAGQGGFDRICGYGGEDGIAGGEDSISVDGGAGADEIVGSDQTDTIFGGEGNDSISGGLGRDDLTGGPGDDDLRGEGDVDLIFGGKGVDLLLGGDGSDIMRGDEGNDILNGGPDNDDLKGGEDNDVIVGGPGKDEVFGDQGEDELVGGGDRDDLHGGIGDDHVNGSGAEDQIRGDDGDDLLFGGPAGDEIFGNGDNDRLTGNGGRDTLRGGAGIDHADGGGNGDLCWGESFEGCAEEHDPG
jgi:alpha-tubulin suppressor-like RCC1 family protein